MATQYVAMAVTKAKKSIFLNSHFFKIRFFKTGTLTKQRFPPKTTLLRIFFLDSDVHVKSNSINKE